MSRASYKLLFGSVLIAYCFILLLPRVASAENERFLIEYDAQRNEFGNVQKVDSAFDAVGSPSPFFPGFVFERGDMLYVAIKNAHYDVEFKITTTVSDLPIPEVAPVYGADVSLKKVSIFDPEIKRFAGAAIELQAGEASFINNFITNLVEKPASGNGSFRDYLVGVFDNALSKPSLREAANVPMEQLRPALEKEAELFVSRLADHSNKLQTFLKTILPCYPNDVASVFAGREQFNNFLRERQVISNDLTFSQMNELTEQLGDAQTKLTKPEVKTLLLYRESDLDKLRGALDELDIDDVARWTNATLRREDIELLKKLKGKYPIGELEKKLDAIKSNVILSLQFYEQFGELSQLVTAVRKNVESLEGYLDRTNQNNITALQNRIREVNRFTASIVIKVNDFPEKVPYVPERYELGQWFGSKRITIQISRRKRLRDYDATELLKSLAGPAATQSVISGATQEAPLVFDKFKEIKQSRVEVHQLYHFRLTAGFVYSGLRDEDFTVATRTVPDSSGAVDEEGDPKSVAEKFLLATKERNYHFFPSLNLVYYPKARDYFPGRSAFPAIGILAGFSLTDPKDDFLFGANVEFSPLVAFSGGLHLGLVPELPEDLEPGDTIPPDQVVVIEEKLSPAAFGALSLDLQFFKNVIGGIFGL